MLTQRAPLILSGAMGTELERRGVDIGIPLWSARALITSPDVVLQIHKEYIDAGADIIVTNTFRTNRRVFNSAHLADQSLALTTKAVKLAHQARESVREREILIAGCVAPVEDSYKPELVPTDEELRTEHAELIERLVTLGVDFILIETMTTIREAYAACAAAKASGKEVIVSFTCKQDGTLYGGEQLSEAIESVSTLDPTMFSLNCISPRYLAPLIVELQSVTRTPGKHIPFAVYGNVGKPDIREGEMVVDVDVGAYAEYAKGWKRDGASVIGGCCGTTPEYIRQLRNIL